MVACTGLLATKCWSARQIRKEAAEPSDSCAEIGLVWGITQYMKEALRKSNYFMLIRIAQIFSEIRRNRFAITTHFEKNLNNSKFSLNLIDFLKISF